MTQTINWQPENELNQEIIKLSQSLGKSPSAIIESAMREYIQKNQEKTDIKQDSLIGLFEGKPNLSTQCEEILTEEISLKSGWTWKE
ncbi:MAG: hypothetical protein IGQ45_04355 [Cyanobacterium sp. T60_A2020_053]|nr:hypothetical protein [Cyanobacterium sp. T60_A2020_053]